MRQERRPGIGMVHEVEERIAYLALRLRNALLCAWLRHRGLRLGPGVRIHPGALVDAKGGQIEIGLNSTIHSGARLVAANGFIKIGEYCSVNPGCLLYGNGGLTIGNFVRIAGNSVIIPANHCFDDLSRPIFRQGELRRGIKIGDDVWLGAAVTVLDGVTIANGCVVGAGAVVTRSTQSNGVYVGNPAKCIRFRGVGRKQ